MNRLDATLAFNQSVLRVRAQRQELIAGNIANADTPNYKARDINFNDALNSALSGNETTGSGLGVNKTASNHLDGDPTSVDYVPSGKPGEPMFRPLIQGSVDGNTVDMDVERNQFADNAIRYEASLNMINGQIKKLLSAIQGQ
ncbi:flagellar basal body rod protein FlgB [Methylovorus menthalis]|uniref:flagellar basal body rod protein FlgB n=1 Tax=Methylovorus menthalis TaxID=1002227 RepID=UPI001E34E2E9|nr:flagellar basal body rod protein FlgB [Methylovorus menthalis]MCB4812329.1 flagellar basal body rod protein FlgB [Methylovorus menthalis]